MAMDRRYRAPKIVSPREQGPSWLRILLLLLILSVVGWYGYQLGARGSKGVLDVLKPTAMQRVATLESERDELRRQLTVLRQTAEMDTEALKAIKQQVKQFQSERLKMEEELAFLRGIVSTGPDKKGLRIQRFKLELGLEPGEYVYQFVVSQVINSGRVAKGQIFIRLEGLQDGHGKTLELKELSSDKLSSHKMRFRYFQNIKGKLRLPDGFKPATLTIEVKPVNKKLETVTRSFDWAPQG